MARKNVYTVPPQEGSFGFHLREERLKRGWTQRELADKIRDKIGGSFEQGQLSAYEVGRFRNPNVDVVNALDTIFGLPKGTMDQYLPTRGIRRSVDRAVPVAGSHVIEPDENDPLYLTVTILKEWEDDEIASVLRGLELKARDKMRRSRDGASTQRGA